jgi:hypothetical protein
MTSEVRKASYASLSTASSIDTDLLYPRLLSVGHTCLLLDVSIFIENRKE